MPLVSCVHHHQHSSIMSPEVQESRRRMDTAAGLPPLLLLAIYQYMHLRKVCPDKWGNNIYFRV